MSTNIAPEIRALFSPQKVAEFIKNATPIERTFYDLFCPKSRRRQYHGATIPLSMLNELVNVVPVSGRSGPYVNVGGDDLEVISITPLPILLEDTITGQMIRDYQTIQDFGEKKAWAQAHMQRIADYVQVTVEALVAQAVCNGKISHPLLTRRGSYSTYEVTYGAPIHAPTVSAAAKWTHADATLVKITNQLREWSKTIGRSGVSGTRWVGCGTVAYDALSALMPSPGMTAGAVGARMKDDGTIVLPGFEINLMDESYINPQTEEPVQKIPDNEIRMIARGNQGLVYAGLDNIQHGLKPMPLMIDTELTKGPSTIRLIGESKPIPTANPLATLKAVVA